jgi:antirestriction protein ArdC
MGIYGQCGCGFQRPNATHVARFRAWLGLGGHVRKGEKGIAILTPVTRKRKSDAQEEREGDNSSTGEAACYGSS